MQARAGQSHAIPGCLDRTPELPAEAAGVLVLTGQGEKPIGPIIALAERPTGSRMHGIEAALMGPISDRCLPRQIRLLPDMRLNRYNVLDI